MHQLSLGQPHGYPRACSLQYSVASNGDNFCAALTTNPLNDGLLLTVSSSQNSQGYGRTRCDPCTFAYLTLNAGVVQRGRDDQLRRERTQGHSQGYLKHRAESFQGRGEA